jgi:hypothetical protein
LTQGLQNLYRLIQPSSKETGDEEGGEQAQQDVRCQVGGQVAQAALECEAVIIDEGTKTGVSELVGQGVADRGRKTKLIGVLPQGIISSPGEPAAEGHWLFFIFFSFLPSFTLPWGDLSLCFLPSSTRCLSSSTFLWLWLIQSEVVEVHRCVEEEHVPPACLHTPERIIGEGQAVEIV